MHGFASEVENRHLGYNPKQIDMAKRYIQHWKEFKKNSTGLLLWGNVGTGKSFIAGCIANALLDKGVPVIMTNFARLLNKLTDMYPCPRSLRKSARQPPLSPGRSARTAPMWPVYILMEMTATWQPAANGNTFVEIRSARESVSTVKPLTAVLFAGSTTTVPVNS